MGLRLTLMLALTLEAEVVKVSDRFRAASFNGPGPRWKSGGCRAVVSSFQIGSMQISRTKSIIPSVKFADGDTGVVGVCFLRIRPHSKVSLLFESRAT